MYFILPTIISLLILFIIFKILSDFDNAPLFMPGLILLGGLIVYLQEINYYTGKPKLINKSKEEISNYIN